MAKSIIEKNSREEIDKVVLEFIKIVEDFASNELQSILSKSDGSKVFSFSKNEYFLGRYIIVKNKQSKMWDIVDHDGGLLQCFYSKQAALLYAYAKMKSKFQLSSEIVRNDHLVGKYQLDLDFFVQKLKQPGLDNDQRCLYASKYSNSKVMLKHSQEELEKTLKTAKYIKLGT